MLAAGVDDGVVVFDLAALLLQDGKPAEAADIFARGNEATAPAYALEAAVRANRAIGRYDEAARLARLAIQRFPNDATASLLLSLTLSDAGRADEALAVLQTPAARAASRVDWLLASAHAHRRNGEPFVALRQYLEAMRLAPQNVSARREAAELLDSLGGPYGAAQIAGRSPVIAASQAAAQVRWGEDVRARNPARRFEGTDRAIAALDAQLAANEDAGLRRRLRLDRLIAWRDRFRMDEVIAEAESLAAQQPLPPFAEEAYADALLYAHRPGDARAAYRRVLAAEPGNIQARYGNFYASIELEDFTSAYAEIDALLRDEPIWRNYKDDPTRYPNAQRTGTEIAAASARLYAGQLSDAWDRIAPLTNNAPANADLRVARSQVALARGWRRQATEDAEIAASLAPDKPAPQIALVEVAIATFRYDEADRRLKELAALYPEDLRVRRLLAVMDAERRWLLEVEVSPRFSSGGGANALGQELQSQARLYTPPIADHWRLFAANTYNYANPPEGFVWRNQAAIGADFRSADLLASAYVAPNWGTLARVAAGGRIDWAIDDQLTVGASVDFFSLDTPMRALFYGISSDQYTIRATYRWHESRSLAALFSYQPFTDGNQRLGATITYQERLIDLPHFWLAGLAEVSGSTNSLGAAAPYFNPVSDLSITGGAIAQHVLWKSYDTSLTQVLQAQAGLYEQYGYGGSWIGVASYQHRWTVAPLTELHYGVQVTRRLYDGSEFRELAILAGFRRRI